MIKFIAKRVLPFIASNLDLDIDTVVKSDGTYIRIRVEAFGFVLLDRLVKTSQERPVKKLSIDQLIDITDIKTATKNKIVLGK